ncbi:MULTISPECIES: hypothetical protein [Stenotrophomonas]|uniref:Uncharacterized protein n=1 Tax=Stenotrophomonas lactitubi TaxID=2045214 RepID=A0AAW4GJJ0_9GAMM|nr:MULTISPECIES: hypothetical protein [Stenotrophomonas]MBM9915266.1 hypothetical protein [Stenotrophomonas lactitubi]MBM9922131.1 hypothetical protein [Stenotrophomonas lactitubi]MBM9936696.1 hypothetical protein [Stenotrophomonas lactitubi]
MQLTFGDAERLGKRKRKQTRRVIWTGKMRRRTLYFSAKSMLRLMSDSYGSPVQCHVPLWGKWRWIWKTEVTDGPWMNTVHEPAAMRSACTFSCLKGMR